MKKLLFFLLAGSSLFLIPHITQAQITIDVNLNHKHSVGGIDTFDRSKFITIHADQRESDWGGWNFAHGANLADTFLNGLDVYLGRNTGGISWQLSQMNEDPNRPGYADSTHVASRGTASRNSYANQTQLHQYEKRNNLVVASQQRPFFPDGTLTGKGWAFANGHASGEYMGHYLKHFHGGNGQPAPAFMEVMNEPLWEFVTLGNYSPADVFQYHNEVAEEIRKRNPGLLIGGYTAAFPDFERNDFQRWHGRMKLFMDMSGNHMDFWAIHLYDFSALNGKGSFRKGSHIEATMDMVEHYSQLLFDEVKPFEISEYGAVTHDLNNQPWSAYRDWILLKSLSSQMMSFMDRPNNMLFTLPFFPVKAEWGRISPTVPYTHRLMRQAKEAPGETGDYWVYTEIVKFYQLWSDVRGTRIDSRSTNLDIQTDAYVEGDKLYLILNNLNFDSTTVDLNLQNEFNNPVQNIRVKHLYLNAAGDTPVLMESNHNSLSSITLPSEATAVLEYTFQNALTIDERSDETKYYASEYLQKIVAGSHLAFQIDSVQLAPYGEAVLRLGIGRPHGTELKPVVSLNGKKIHVPDNYMGYDQATRDSWFGVREIPVPYALLREKNEVTVQFPDNGGGHVSSVSLQVFNFTEALYRSDSVRVTGVELLPPSKELTPGSSYQLLAEVLPTQATNHGLTWSTTDASVATVDNFGEVTAVALGNALIIVSTQEGGFADTCQLDVLSMVNPVAVNSTEISPDSFTLNITDFLQLNAHILPIDAANKAMTWTTSDPTIATVDTNGYVSPHMNGWVKIAGTTVDGGISDTCFIEVVSSFATFVKCDFLPTNVPSATTYNLKIDYSAGYQFDIAIELKDANNNWVGEGRTTVNPGVGTADIQVKCVSTINWTDPVFPDPGTDYVWRAWIRTVGGNWTTNMGGCHKGDVTITTADAIDENELTGVSIFPNPVKEVLIIELLEGNHHAKVRVTNILGADIMQREVVHGLNRIEVGKLPSGVYLVKVESEKGALVRKIVVE